MTYRPYDPEFYQYLQDGMPQAVMDSWKVYPAVPNLYLEQRNTGIVAAYNRGMTAEEVASDFGMSARAVAHIVADARASGDKIPYHKPGPKI